uniref:SRPBCC family protein n=1 Tax=Pedobacter schmidteae TaxID=2201271 RepID=UPI000EAFF9A5|nr:SRPBCC domain-containing protein [Pedobacter schmidteae]
MNNQDFTTSFLVSQSPKQVFDAINNVRGWWSEQIEGPTDQPDATFKYHYRDIHLCTMKIVEFVPDKKVVWFVEDNYFNFTRNEKEWTGTKVRFEIAEKGDQTELIFTHEGLVPAEECYDICAGSWGNYIKSSLKSLIETGKGNPNPYEASVQKAEALKAEKR